MHAQKEENATASGGRARTGRAHHGLGLRRPRTATSGSGGVGRRRRQQPMAAASGDGSGGGQRNGGFGMAAKGARYNNRTKAGWNLLYVLMLGAFLVRILCCHFHGLVKELSWWPSSKGSTQSRYSKEEEISTEEYQKRNFTYLLNEHRYISGYKCLFAVDGFSRAKIRPRIPPLSGRYPQNLLQVKEPKVFAHGNMRYPDILSLDCPSCPLR